MTCGFAAGATVIKSKSRWRVELRMGGGWEEDSKSLVRRTLEVDQWVQLKWKRRGETYRFVSGRVNIAGEWMVE